VAINNQMAGGAMPVHMNENYVAPPQALISDAGVGVTAGMSVDAARNVIHGMGFARFRACYRKAINLNPTVAGTIMISATVNADGEVTGSSLVSSTLNDAPLNACMVAAMKSLKFPALTDDKTTGSVTTKVLLTVK
jgi:hypothetical protein